MLSFKITNAGKKIQISCDQQGLERLISELIKLRGTADSIRLVAPSLGGIDLDDLDPWGETSVPEVILITGGDL